MAFHCFKCGSELVLASDGRTGRRDSCHSCNSDLHCCRNCAYYDPKAYNHCTESQAERVLEKDRSNFCDYFSFFKGNRAAGSSDARAQTLKNLDDLFKK